MNCLLAKHHDVSSLLRQGCYSYNEIVRITGKSRSTVIKVSAALWDARVKPAKKRSPLLLIQYILSGVFHGRIIDELVSELVGDVELD